MSYIIQEWTPHISNNMESIYEEHMLNLMQSVLAKMFIAMTEIDITTFLKRWLV